MAQVSLPTRHYNAMIAIQDALSVIRNEFYEVRVFGSCVRSSANAVSDIDILVLTVAKLNDRVKREHIRELISEAAEPYGIEVDVVFYSLDSYLYDSSNFTLRLRAESKGLVRGTDHGL